MITILLRDRINKLIKSKVDNCKSWEYLSILRYYIELKDNFDLQNQKMSVTELQNTNKISSNRELKFEVFDKPSKIKNSTTGFASKER